MITFHPLQTLRYIHNRNMMEKELNNILNRWLMRISETGSFDPHQHKDDYLQITEYICTCKTPKIAQTTLKKEKKNGKIYTS